ncbi:hypothetical protein LEP1GSC043_0678 [Leptospira weilii str. Ecochallenge]|uniref:Uncharacterized protein n=1 Tax=Leptospira weilii str. Ecochallenge TaxID=1049986 RepID=N1U3A9_9LEPT|nr:hypothetical protein LEP1GSC043_0678 [Leptospira weilii str. Ecochallenge]
MAIQGICSYRLLNFSTILFFKFPIHKNAETSLCLKRFVIVAKTPRIIEKFSKPHPANVGIPQFSESV